MSSMARLDDYHSLLVLFTTIYFSIIAVLNGYMAVNGVISFETYVSAHTLVFINIFFGLAYLVYTTRWKGDIVLKYENTDWRVLPKYAFIGAVLHFLTFLLQTSGIMSVSQLALTTYYLLLGSAYAFVAITENAFFIGVIGDYVAERFNYSRRGKIYASIVAGLLAGLSAMVFHFGPYGGSPAALFIVALFFGYWTFASLETRSTLYADVHHAVGNYIGFVWSTVEVIA